MTSKNIATIFFEGQQETLEIIKTGKPIVRYLARENEVCPLLGNEVKINRELGKGAFGTVFDITFEGQGTNKYAMKKVLPPVKPILYVPIRDPRTKWADVASEHNVPLDTLQNFNNVKPRYRGTYVQGLDFVMIPEFLKPCKEGGESYPRVDDPTRYTVTTPGSAICNAEYSEYLLALLTGNFYRNGICANFIDAFYFATCDEPDQKERIKQYTFMEQISGSIRASRPDDEDRKNAITAAAKAEIAAKDVIADAKEAEIVKYTGCLTIQTIFALAVAQAKLRLVHGDLHDGNVFIKKIDRNTTWKGQTLHDADYFEYNLYGRSIYVPSCPYLVKIGDYGLSCKYTNPMILNSAVMETGMDEGPTSEGEPGEGPIIPNFFSSSYDVMFYVTSMTYFRGINKPGTQKSIMSDKDYELLNKIKSFILSKAGYTDWKSLVNPNNSRPWVTRLTATQTIVSPYNILMDDTIMEGFLERPKRGKIVMIGEL
jgi:serine/threonine protein kinase